MSSAAAVIDLDVVGPKINKHLYGHFAEHLGRCIYGGFWVGEDSDLPNVGGIRTDVVEALRALDIPNLRWPGGCFADEYHWMDGIGPRDQRPRMVNTHWGNVEENNHFGTHEFMQLCELLGADPYINGNVGSGTVREMSEWVEYLTRDGASPMVSLRKANGRDKPWRVPFFGIGNEAWGCGGQMRAEAYADEARRYATYLRDHGDNTLYRIAAGASDGDLAWTEALLKAVSEMSCGRVRPRKIFQGVSFHYYSHSGEGIRRTSATEFDEDAFYRTMIKANGIEPVLRGHSALMDVYDPEHSLGLICDEWGTWWDVEPGTNPGFLYQQNTLRDALVAGLHFDIFHRHAERLVMANIAQTVNVLQAMILTDQDSGALVLTPTYHVFEMNKGHQDAQRLPAHLISTPEPVRLDDDQLQTVSLTASTTGGQALLSLTNLSATDDLTLTVDLRGRGVSAAEARLLSADRPQAHNAPGSAAVAPVAYDVALADGKLTVELPKHSFATVTLELA
jgi:alpha-N-arabinofuranosidase